MKNPFAREVPIATKYDATADALYVYFSYEAAKSTVLVLAEWPKLALDVNEEEQVVGMELVGVKQFGIEYFINNLAKVDLNSPVKSYLEQHKEELAVA